MPNGVPFPVALACFPSISSHILYKKYKTPYMIMNHPGTSPINAHPTVKYNNAIGITVHTNPIKVRVFGAIVGGNLDTI